VHKNGFIKPFKGFTGRQTQNNIFYIMLILTCLLIPTTNMLLNEVNKPYGLGRPGRIIITACAADETNWDYGVFEGGVFTHFFVEGNRNTKNCSVEKAFYYAQNKTHNFDGRNPQIYDGIPGDFYISSYGDITKKELKNLYVLLICIEDYPNMDDATYAMNNLHHILDVVFSENVQAFDYEYNLTDAYKKFLLTNNITHVEYVKTITNADATKINIENNITWLAHNTKPGDAVIMYFSGHGGHGCIYVYDDTITKQELNTYFNNIKTGVNIVIMFNCCHSGSMI